MSAGRFNASVLVLEIQRLLGERGVTVLIDLGNASAAVSAAANLLRVLNVEPSAGGPGRGRRE